MNKQLHVDLLKHHHVLHVHVLLCMYTATLSMIYLFSYSCLHISCNNKGLWMETDSR